MNEADRIRRERRRLRSEYKELYDEVSRILYHHDPIRINFGDNPNEYEPEVRTILPRLKEAQSADDLRRIIHEEFVRWFDTQIAGSDTLYAAVAHDIWLVWKQRELDLAR